MTPENVDSKPPNSPRAWKGKDRPKSLPSDGMMSGSALVGFSAVFTSSVRVCKSTKYSSSGSEDRISSNPVRNLSVIYIQKVGVCSSRSPPPWLARHLTGPWMALLLWDLMLAFVQYLLVGVITDSQNHQDYIFVEWRKIRKLPPKRKKRGGEWRRRSRQARDVSKGPGLPEWFPRQAPPMGHACAWMIVHRHAFLPSSLSAGQDEELWKVRAEEAWPQLKSREFHLC